MEKKIKSNLQKENIIYFKDKEHFKRKCSIFHVTIDSNKKMFRIFKQGKLLVQFNHSDVSDSL